MVATSGSNGCFVLASVAYSRHLLLIFISNHVITMTAIFIHLKIFFFSQ